ncbi:MAG: tetratricopeptide repeat protein [Candidatus Symbiothrix sp.]|nr:tetratricopeptide repeat protein [Candidatus Symbiothrix sp.]
MLEQQPDSALHLLQFILFPEELNKKQSNKYNLFLTQVRDKCDKDITADTVIFAVKDYYVQRKDYPNAALAAFYCGRVLHEQKNADKATTAYLEAADLAGKTDNYNLKGLIQGNLGILYCEHSLDRKKAIAMSKNAVEMYDKAQNHKNKINALSTIGNCFLIENEIDSAFYYYNLSLIFADSFKIVDIQSKVRQNIGVAYREKGDYKKSKELFREALSLSIDSVEQARILINIAKVYIHEIKKDSAKIYLNQALLIHVEDPKLIRSLYYLLFTIEEKEQHHSEALRYHKEYYRLTTEILYTERNNNVLEIQGKYDFEKLKNSKNKEIIKQKNTLNVISLILFVACIITLLYYLKYHRTEKCLSETKQSVINLEKLANDYEKQVKDYSEENQSVRNILLQHFEILKKAALIKNEINEDERKSGQNLIKKFNKIVYGQNDLDWGKLYQTLNTLSNGFYDKAREKYPKLTELEFRVCCLSCETDLNDTDISLFIGKSIDMVRRLRSDLRKKIGITSAKQKIRPFLEDIFAGK